MTKFVLATLLAISLLVPSMAQAKMNPLTQAREQSITVYADMAESVTEGENSQDAFAYDTPACSGFVYESYRGVSVIITARHCVTDTVETNGDTVTETHVYPTRVHFFDGDFGTIDSVFMSKTHDVALMIVSSNHAHVAAKMHYGVKTNEDLLAIGAPRGYEWVLATLKPVQGNDLVEEYDNPAVTLLFPTICSGCAGGISGAGVLNQSGQTVGIITMEDELYNYVVPESDIVNFYHEVKSSVLSGTLDSDVVVQN
jgi:hypothetical protein